MIQSILIFDITTTLHLTPGGHNPPGSVRPSESSALSSPPGSLPTGDKLTDNVDMYILWSTSTHCCYYLRCRHHVFSRPAVGQRVCENVAIHNPPLTRWYQTQVKNTTSHNKCTICHYNHMSTKQQQQVWYGMLIVEECICLIHSGTLKWLLPSLQQNLILYVKNVISCICVNVSCDAIAILFT